MIRLTVTFEENRVTMCFVEIAKCNFYQNRDGQL